MTLGRHRPAPAAGALAIFFISLAMPGAPALVRAQGADSAREIMRRVLRDSRAEDEVADVLMELVDAKGRVRRRATTIYSKKRTAQESMRLIRFRDPPDLARSAILTIEHADRDADQWIYMPAYHAARRVASTNRGDTWMGTDFTYEDITDPKIEQYEYTVLRHDQLGNVRCTVIEAVPTDRSLREQSAYSRTIFWIDADESVALKIEYHDRSGRLFKVLTNAQLRRHGRYRRWDVTRVQDVIRNHQTVVTVTDRKIDRGLSDEYFDVSYLERGR
jgi:uncharacterized protein